MIQLNLLPDIKKEFLRAEKTRNLVIGFSILATIIAVGVTVFLAFFVYIVQGAYSGFLSSDIQKHYKELQGQTDINKYLTIQNQSAKLDALHDSKYLYSRGFDYLRQLNPSNPNSATLTAAAFTKETNEATLEGNTANFETLNAYKTTLENAQLNYKDADGKNISINMFDSVSLVTAVVTDMQNRGSQATFKIVAVYNKAVFDPAIKNATLSVPQKTLSDADNNAPAPIQPSPSSTEEGN